MLEEIYEAFMNDNYIAEQADERIKFYQYPPTAEMDKPHIIIDPLDVPIPSDFGDDTWLTDDYLYQIEVWSHDYHTTKELSYRIRKVMWSLGFGQGEGIDEWDRDYDIYRDARQYRGKAYRSDLEVLK